MFTIVKCEFYLNDYVFKTQHLELEKIEFSSAVHQGKSFPSLCLSFLTYKLKKGVHAFFLGFYKEHRTLHTIVHVFLYCPSCVSYLSICPLRC